MTDEVARRIATASNRAVRHRNYRRARDRALARLANAYPDDYKELLEQERANDERLGKSWIDIAGNTTASGMGTRTNAPTTGASGSDNRTQEGNYGGEK